MKDIFENYKPYKEKATRQAYRSRTNFNWNKMQERIDELLTQQVPELPKKVELKLPNLKKIELPKKPV